MQGLNDTGHRDSDDDEMQGSATACASEAVVLNGAFPMAVRCAKPKLSWEGGNKIDVESECKIVTL